MAQAVDMFKETEKNYLPVVVYEPRKVLDFLTQHLDFEDHSLIKKRYVGRDGVMAGNGFGNNFLFLPRTFSVDVENFDDTIRIKTTNLLKDFHRLRNSGVKIEHAPKYTHLGLEMMFSDHIGNRYKLIEKRDYSDI